MRPTVVFLLLSVLACGCAAPLPPAPPPPPPGITKVKFVMPEGSTMTVDGLTPSADSAIYRFERPGAINAAKETHLTFSFKVADSAKPVTADGTIQIKGYQGTEMDEKAVSFCEISEEQVQNIAKGYAVAFDGVSPSKKPVYHMVIGLK